MEDLPDNIVTRLYEEADAVELHAVSKRFYRLFDATKYAVKSMGPRLAIWSAVENGMWDKLQWLLKDHSNSVPTDSLGDILWRLVRGQSAPRVVVEHMMHLSPRIRENIFVDPLSWEIDMHVYEMSQLMNNLCTDDRRDRMEMAFRRGDRNSAIRILRDGDCKDFLDDAMGILAVNGETCCMDNLWKDNVDRSWDFGLIITYFDGYHGSAKTAGTGMAYLLRKWGFDTVFAGVSCDATARTLMCLDFSETRDVRLWCEGIGRRAMFFCDEACFPFSRTCKMAHAAIVRRINLRSRDYLSSKYPTVARQIYSYAMGFDLNLPWIRECFSGGQVSTNVAKQVVRGGRDAMRIMLNRGDANAMSACADILDVIQGHFQDTNADISTWCRLAIDNAWLQRGHPVADDLWDAIS